MNIIINKIYVYIIYIIVINCLNVVQKDHMTVLFGQLKNRDGAVDTGHVHYPWTFVCIQMKLSRSRQRTKITVR